ncbi:MAG: type III-A CRISPR-associated RAMP protein Csm5 [Actinobacteria bacterium]|nr:type III-A CRISPR-associated RAMP protein Csm5 [Actinomycetota bacterium]
MKIYQINIKFISPVHIGCGIKLDPISYVVKDHYFYRINLEKFVSSLDSSLREKLVSIIDANNLLKLRKFIAEFSNITQYSIYKVKATKNFEYCYFQKLNDLRNQLFVDSFIRSAEGIAYLPGSSIKGSIRTAVLNYFLNRDFLSKNVKVEDSLKRRIGDRRISKDDLAKETEAEILRFRIKNFGSDPLRALRISDAFIRDNRYLLVAQIINRRFNNKEGRQKFWQQFCELTSCTVIDEGNNKVNDIISSLTIDDDLIKKADFKTKLSMSIIANACNYFYKKIANYERERFYIKSTDSRLDKLFSEINNTSENEFILRMGRFSHFESLTLEDFESLKRRGFGKSRNMAEGVLPLGWTKVVYKEVG